MRQTIKLANNINIEIEKIPFAKGGEADIFHITSPQDYTSQVLKVYKTEKKANEKEKKISYLINNKPNLTLINGHHSIIWPNHLAYSDNKFIGYTMHKASGIKLEYLCHPKLPKNLSKEWEKFALHRVDAIESRLKLCFNISAALSQIHSYGSYVLVDMKPDNIMVNLNGLISLIDIDSIEIIQNKSILFPAQVATPDYTPPEFYTKGEKIENSFIEETWDRFSMAVVFYRILFGIHPFTASLKSPYNDITTLSDIIQKGFLPVGKSSNRFSTIPPLHDGFKKLDNNIQYLFLNALEESIHEPNSRPSTDDWCRILSPPPEITINRELPSRKLPLIQPIYSESIILKPVLNLGIKKPSHINTKEENCLLIKLTQIFTITKKQTHRNKILTLHKLAENLFEELRPLKQSLENERKKHLNTLSKLLNTEKEAIKTLHLAYIKNAKDIDNKAKKMLEHELNEYNSFEKKYIRDINNIYLQTKKKFNSIIAPFDQEHTKETNKLREAIFILDKYESEQVKKIDSTLINNFSKKKQQIKSLDNHLLQEIIDRHKEKFEYLKKKKQQIENKKHSLILSRLEAYQFSYIQNALSRYKISDEIYSIFTDQYANHAKIESNLASNGIQTAADIKGVDETGLILKSNGQWIKVPDIATSRAKKLYEWTKKKERLCATPPQSLPYSEEVNINKIISPELNKVEEEENALRQQIINSNKNNSPHLSVQLRELKSYEDQLIAESEAQKASLLREYKQKRETINEKIKVLNTNYHQQRHNQEKLFQSQIVDLNNQLTDHDRAKEQFYTKTKKKYDDAHEKITKELQLLGSTFITESSQIRQSTTVKMSNISSSMDRFFKTTYDKINVKLESFNSTMQELESELTKYAILYHR